MLKISTLLSLDIKISTLRKFYVKKSNCNNLHIKIYIANFNCNNLASKI